ncbi:hypothetical protein [Metallibacterium sp.]
MRIRRLVLDVDKAFAQPGLLDVAAATQGQSALAGSRFWQQAASRTFTWSGGPSLPGAASDPALAVVLQDRVMLLGVEEWMAKAMAWIATNKVMLLATWRGIEP